MARPKKDEKFRIEAFTNASGSKSWRVSGTAPDGRRVRRNFKDKAEAIEVLADMEAELRGVPLERRSQRTTLTANQLSDAEAALQAAGGRQLAPIVSIFLSLEVRAQAKGLSLDSAMEFIESRYRPELKEISILNARDRFLATRTGRAAKTVTFYESCTKQLLNPDPNRLLHRVEVSDLEQILGRYENANSKRAFRRAFSVFFNWAIRQHFCLENPCDRLDRPPPSFSPNVILSLKEVHRLLRASVEYKESVMAPIVAIALFGGLRPSEIAALKPSDVRDDRIRVTGGKLRGKLKRTVPLSANLKTWMEHYPFIGVPESMVYRMKVLKKATEAANWVQDILRHTSISYQVERDKNEGLTAFNNGTSKEMMDRHYRDVIEDPREVKKFWAITPQSQAKEKLEVKLPGHQDAAWPPKAKLSKLVWERPMIHVANELGVSDVALKNHCVKLGLDLPPLGYWLRQGW